MVVLFACALFAHAETNKLPLSTQMTPVPKPSSKAISYFRSSNALWVADQFLAIALPGFLVFSGLSAKLRSFARIIGNRSWLGTLFVYFVLFTLMTAAVDLPLNYYRGFVREHAYGLSSQKPAKWLSDFAISLGVQLVIGLALVWIPYLLFLKSPNRWCLYAWMLSVPLMVLGMLVMPVWIDPLFNTFGPMKNKELETKILDLANRAGIEGGRVFEVAKSVDTNKVNAYVTGLGSTKRIVLWDTMHEKLDEGEILAIMGHEMGHYVLGHVIRTIFVFAVCNLLAFCLVSRACSFVIARWKNTIGFERLSDPASLPLLFFLSQVLTLACSPMALAYSRSQEHEADRFALEITHDNASAGSSFAKMVGTNLSVPRPGLFYKIWRASHPSLGERIDFCNTYHPWLENKKGEYDHLFIHSTERLKGERGK